MAEQEAEKAYEELLKAFVMEMMGSTPGISYKAPRVKVTICGRGCAERAYRRIIRELDNKAVNIGYILNYSLNERSLVKMFYELIYPEMLKLNRCVHDDFLGMDMCMEILDAGYGYVFVKLDDKYVEALKKHEDPKKLVKPYALMDYMAMHIARNISHVLSLITPIPLALELRLYGVYDGDVLTGFKIEYDLVPLVVPTEIARLVHEEYMARKIMKKIGKEEEVEQ